MKRLLLPALLLAGLALQPSLAAADNNGLEWRRGNGYDIWYRYPGEHNWRRAPGSARDVSDGWVIGTARKRGGYAIYRWDGRKWHEMPGAAVSIGGGYYNPWVVNDRGERFSWNGYTWVQEPNFRPRNDRHDDRRDDHGRNDRDRNDRGDRGRDDNDWNHGRSDNRPGHRLDALEEQWRRNRNR